MEAGSVFFSLTVIVGAHLL